MNVSVFQSPWSEAPEDSTLLLNMSFPEALYTGRMWVTHWHRLATEGAWLEAWELGRAQSLGQLAKLHYIHQD